MSMTLAVSVATGVGQTWAGLDFHRASAFGIDSVESLLDAQDSGELADAVLFDSNVEGVCDEILWRPNTSRPLMQAMPTLPVPRFFPRDYQAALDGPRRSGQRVKSDPDLFLSAAGTSTHVHIDSGCTRFYMVQLAGRKLWRVFPPSAVSHLSPTKSGHLRANIMRPDRDRFPTLANISEVRALLTGILSASIHACTSTASLHACTSTVRS
jgi:hypothetical protein